MTSFEFESVRQRMKSVRNHLGKNQTEMGELTGKGVYYGNIERGNQEPALMTLIDIANTLNIDPDWLLYGTGKSPIPEKLPIKTPEIIPMVEVKKELAPMQAFVPSPEPEPIPAENSNPMADYDEIVHARQRLMQAESDQHVFSNVTMKLRQGVFDMEHGDGFKMTCTFCWNRDKTDVIIAIHQENHQPYNYELSPSEANQFADIVRFAACKALEVLV